MVYNWFDFDDSLYGYDFLLESMFVQFLTFNSKHNNCNWGLAYGFGFQLYKSLAFAR